MAAYDGPTLRAIRESMGVPLRRVARQVGMSHGHLSKVERGEHGRPITPAVLAAYEKVTGVSLADAAAAIAEQRESAPGRRGRSWRPGQLTDMRRLAFNAAVGAIAVGGQLGEPLRRLLDSTGRPAVPTVAGVPDVAQLAEFGDMLARCDLRFGGALPSQFAKTVLRWAVAMAEPTSGFDPEQRPLFRQLAVIAARAAWASFDVGSHEAARSLFRMALFFAVRAEDHDLRAHIVADSAAHHSHLGYHDDALDVIRLVGGDERPAAAVRMMLHWVKARIYGAAGSVDECRRQIVLAEDTYAEADPEAPGWVGTLRRPGSLAAATGHAMAELSGHTGSAADVAEAQRRLTEAVDALDRDTCGRGHALCTARLALLQISGGELESAVYWGAMAVRSTEQVQSGRLRRALSALRKAAGEYEGDPAVRELIEALDAVDHDGVWGSSYVPA
ncbi:helix-turn-helix transcriptional regulator [Natronosporangium hydrolyticum]|uniref:Helix-turn-helix transcriptional regulator n=1 Tax=Natronosporangium hydrolyticum TaxID=2811111 RepID=A0A895YCX0_9ACTN|nr:helix-turn-helix transcriptional regulator [Natronosporangium hydrolyticum]QSB14032.1 helix-turn-helix transcriptional regulator [Natronosporangium hydrolyticum]